MKRLTKIKKCSYLSYTRDTNKNTYKIILNNIINENIVHKNQRITL